MDRLPRRPRLVVFAFLSLGLAPLAVGQEPPAEKPPAHVAGKWTIYAKAADGETSTKYVELKQDGNAITGHFKGPNQSGGLEGTINEQHIVFRTKTRWVFTFAEESTAIPSKAPSMIAVALENGRRSEPAPTEWLRKRRARVLVEGSCGKGTRGRRIPNALLFPVRFVRFYPHV